MTPTRPPHLTFACELSSSALQELFDDPSVIEDLVALESGVAIGLLDLSPERAAVARRLNQAGIPLTAWLLLPEEQGYYFNLNNAVQAARRYEEFRAWTKEHDLAWSTVGLDVEPDIDELRRIMTGNVGPLVSRWLRRVGDSRRVAQARQAYGALIDRIRSDGYLVETYQFPFIVDERRAGAELFQRTMGVIDLPADREVLMLYTSLLPGYAAGILGSYGPDAQGIAVGSTGGGIEVAGGPTIAPLSWEEFARDLRLARRWSDPIFVFSLEGCVEQGFLSRLRDLDWEEAVDLPVDQVKQVDDVRQALQALLWVSARPWLLLVGPIAAMGLLAGLLGYRRWRR